MGLLIPDTLEELAKLLGVPYPFLLGCLAMSLFLAFGSFFSLIIGTNKMLIFGVAPVAGGVLIGIFPIYFVFIGLALGISITFISFSESISLTKSISFKDKIRAVERFFRL